MSIITLDCCGLLCPLPVLKVRKALLNFKTNDEVHVFSTDPMVLIDIPHLVDEMGFYLKSEKEISLKHYPDEKVHFFHIVEKN